MGGSEARYRGGPQGWVAMLTRVSCDCSPERDSFGPIGEPTIQTTCSRSRRRQSLMTMHCPVRNDIGTSALSRKNSSTARFSESLKMAQP